jgi:hypothetical protein
LVELQNFSVHRNERLLKFVRPTVKETRYCVRNLPGEFFSPQPFDQGCHSRRCMQYALAYFQACPRSLNQNLQS